MRSKSITLLMLLFFSSLTISQVKNINAMKGAWQGQWVNTYYQSSGSIAASFTVNAASNTAHGEWNVGGNILGELRGPFSTDITLTQTGFTANFISAIWGTITGTGLFTGAYSGSAANCPNPNATNIAAAGTFTPNTISGTFTFNWYGQPITGTVSMTKQFQLLDPSGLTVNENPAGTGNLNWTDNATNETGYRIERKVLPSGTWTQIATVAAGVHTYQNTGLSPETQYVYRVAAYNASTESEFSNEANLNTVVVAVDKQKTIPSNFLLFQNYPNPFNPSTKIHYSLPRQSNVTISVYNMLGEFIKTLVSEQKGAGSYDIYFNGEGKPSGVYIVKMNAVSSASGVKFVDCKKMVLLK